MKKIAVIVAAGSGIRMGNPVPKQFLNLLGKPLFLHAVEAFAAAYADIFIILVMHPSHMQRARLIINTAGLQQRVAIVEGGNTRSESVQKGLTTVPDGAIVLIHDAARCVVAADLIHRCTEEAIRSGSAIPVIAVTDSVRMISQEGSRPTDRSSLRLVQTPQAFQAKLLKDAYAHAADKNFADDASVLEHAGIAVTLVEGDTFNIKVTYPTDLLIAAALKKELNA